MSMRVFHSVQPHSAGWIIDWKIWKYLHQLKWTLHWITTTKAELWWTQAWARFQCTNDPQDQIYLFRTILILLEAGRLTEKEIQLCFYVIISNYRKHEKQTVDRTGKRESGSVSWERKIAIRNISPQLPAGDWLTMPDWVYLKQLGQDGTGEHLVSPAGTLYNRWGEFRLSDQKRGERREGERNWN